MKEALKLALEALQAVQPECDDFHHKKKEMHDWSEICKPLERYNQAITAIKEALAQPEQEPVARLHITETDTYPDVDVEVLDGAMLQPSMSPVNVYTTPPPVPEAHKRKPLTDAQLEKGREQTFSINNPFCPCDSKTFRKVARWVEAAHDIKE